MQVLAGQILNKITLPTLLIKGFHLHGLLYLEGRNNLLFQRPLIRSDMIQTVCIGVKVIFVPYPPQVRQEERTLWR